MNLEELREKALFYASFPVKRHITKKNNRSIFKNKATGRLFPGKSSDLILAEKNIVGFYSLSRERHGIINPFDFKLHCIFIFHFAKEDFYTKKGEISLKLPDLSNLIQLPEDCLQDAGVIKNDTLIHSLDYSRRVPSLTNRLETFVLKFNEDA